MKIKYYRISDKVKSANCDPKGWLPLLLSFTEIQQCLLVY